MAFTINNLSVRVLTSLGVPGVALLMFWAVVQWVKPNSIVITEGWTGPIAMVIVLSAAVIVYKAITPAPLVSGPVSVSIPTPMSFKLVSGLIAGSAVVQFIGFSDDELDYPISPRQLTAPSLGELFERLGVIAWPGVRPYSVDASRAGLITLIIKGD